MTVQTNGKRNEGYPSDEEILQNWYQYAAQQSQSVGSLLRLLRSRLGLSEEQQQAQLGINAKDFARLQSFPAPRMDKFQGDAQRIAAVCNIEHIFLFVQIMKLARNVGMSPLAMPDLKGYEAAFDAPTREDEGPSGE